MLAGVLGSLELARHSLSTGKRPEEELATAATSASYLLDLVNSLVDPDKAEAGGLVLKRAWIAPGRGELASLTWESPEPSNPHESTARWRDGSGKTRM